MPHICDNRDFSSSDFCDSRDRLFAKLANNNHMKDLQKELRLWLIERLENCGRGAKGALAEHLGVRADAITRMINLEPGKEVRDISVAELEGMAQFFGVAPPTISLVPPSRFTASKFIKSKEFKFYVKDWRDYMGVKVTDAAKAAQLEEDEYEAFETYPINFTLHQVVNLAEVIGVRGDQFWFPPPKKKPVAAPLKSARAKGRPA